MFLNAQWDEVFLVAGMTSAISRPAIKIWQQTLGSGVHFVFQLREQASHQNMQVGQVPGPIEKAKADPVASGESFTYFGDRRSPLLDCPRTAPQCGNERSSRTGHAGEFSSRPSGIGRLDPSRVFFMGEEQCFSLDAALQ